MAVTKTIPAGLINKPVIFKQPTSSLNDEGGQEVTYSTGITTRAHVDRFNEYRATEADGVSLIGALDFTIRWREAADDITKDWLIEYKGFDYVIHLIEPLDQEKRFIRFTAKSKGTAVLSGYSGGGSGGGSVANITDFTFDDLTGDIAFAEDPAPYDVIIVFENVPPTGYSYINGEGVGFSIGPIPSQTYQGAITYLTPSDVTFKWRLQHSSSPFTPVTSWSSKTITVTRLQRRWYRIQREQLGAVYDLYPGFTNVYVLNADGVSMGMFSDIDDVITAWNADPANDGFPIIGYRTLNTFYEVQFEPDASETAYPVQKLTYSF